MKSNMSYILYFINIFFAIIKLIFTIIINVVTNFIKRSTIWGIMIIIINNSIRIL